MLLGYLKIHITGLEQKNQLCLTRNIRTKEGDKKFLNVVTDYPTEALTVLSNIGLQEIRLHIFLYTSFSKDLIDF